MESKKGLDPADVEEVKDKMNEFISDLYTWLESCFLGGKECNSSWPPAIVLDKALSESAKNAWIEFSENYPKNHFSLSIRNFREKSLVAHGLYGKQLKYKLEVFNLLLGKLKDKTTPILQRKFIDAADNLLDSIGHGLPGYGAMKELKDTLKIFIDA